jgi:aspartyl-tRNA(Asn)/glutamyl-tRNA(Gln) amidotransferase subunit B
MRFDVNVSVSQTDELGTRTETKNLNSFRAVEKTVDYEIERQIEVLEKGGTIHQETRGWDDAKQKTFSQRSKENADDYRYMPDPDIPPVTLDDDYINKIKAAMPAMPKDYREKFKQIKIDSAVIEDIIANPATAQLVDQVLAKAGADHARRIAFWMMLTAQNADEESSDETAEQTYNVDHLIRLSELTSGNQLSSTAAKEVFLEVIKSGEDPEAVANAKNLIQVSDEGEIARIVGQVLKDNAQAAEDVKNGEMKAIGFLVGQVMKQSKGKANPQLAQDLIKKQLGL